MNTKLLFTLLLIAFMQITNAQTTVIPDSNFEQALIDLGIDTDGIINGLVLTADIENVLTLDVQSRNISDLTGIEDFTSLQALWFTDNQLVSLDITQNTDLASLRCGFNLLTSLNVINNTALVSLKCDGNQLTSLDVTQNLALTNLSCLQNQLTSLNISNNTLLNELNCHSNQLTSLDVTQNTLLTNLQCYYNQIANLDLTQNSLLNILACSDNNLTSLDVSQNTELNMLVCSNNNITSLDISQNIALTFLTSFNNQLESLNLKNGNTASISTMRSYDNPNLECIQVDEDIVGNIPVNWQYDSGVSFSDDCQYLSVNDIILNKLSIYPNPTSSNLYVNTNSNIEITSLQIFSMQGQLLKKSTSSEIDISELEKGVYLLKAETNIGAVINKIIKK